MSQGVECYSCLPKTAWPPTSLHWACKSLEGLKLIAKGKGKGRVLTKEGRKRADTVAFNVKIHRRHATTKKAKKA